VNSPDDVITGACIQKQIQHFASNAPPIASSAAGLLLDLCKHLNNPVFIKAYPIPAEAYLDNILSILGWNRSELHYEVSAQRVYKFNIDRVL